MKILSYDYEYPPLGGGGGVAHQMVAEELAGSHEVTVVTSRGDGLPARERRGGVEIRRVRVLGRDSEQVASLPSLLSYPPSALLETWSRLRSRSWDLVHGHFAVPTGPASVLAARLLGVPHVLTVYGGDVYDPSKTFSPHRWRGLRAVVGAVLRSSDRVVAESTDIRDRVLRHYAYDGPVEIIPLGVRRPEFSPSTREALDLPAEPLLLVTVGRLVARKGLDDALRVVAGLEDLDAHIAVVGDGPLGDELRRLADRLGVADRVHFLGYVPEETKWQVLACADVYVSTTRHEGFGLVYLEAMLSGLPVVTYARGGQTDFLAHGESGALLDPGDRSGLAAAVRALAGDPERREEIGRENRRRAEGFTARRCAEDYEELFADLLGGDRPGGRAA